MYIGLARNLDAERALMAAPSLTSMVKQGPNYLRARPGRLTAASSGTSRNVCLISEIITSAGPDRADRRGDKIDACWSANCPARPSTCNFAPQCARVAAPANLGGEKNW